MESRARAFLVESEMYRLSVPVTFFGGLQAFQTASANVSAQP